MLYNLVIDGCVIGDKRVEFFPAYIIKLKMILSLDMAQAYLGQALI